MNRLPHSRTSGPAAARCRPVLLALLLLAAGGCTPPDAHRPPAADGLPADPHAVWDETPAAMAILQQRLSESRQQLSAVDEQLQRRTEAVAEADRRLEQLAAAIRQADQQRQRQDEQSNAIGSAIQQLRRDQESLRQQLQAQRQQQDAGRPVANKDAPRLQIQPQPQRPDPPAVLGATGSTSPHDRPQQHACAASARRERRAEVRRYLYEDVGLGGFRLHEIDDFSRPSSAVMRRAMASGGYRVLNHDCRHTGQSLQIRLWADPHSRIGYYTVRRIGRPI